MYNSIFVILLVALKDTTDWNKHQFKCKEITTTWEKEGQANIGIYVNSTYYMTIFESREALVKDVKHQCGRNSNID